LNDSSSFSNPLFLKSLFINWVRIYCTFCTINALQSKNKLQRRSYCSWWSDDLSIPLSGHSCTTRKKKKFVKTLCRERRNTNNNIQNIPLCRQLEESESEIVRLGTYPVFVWPWNSKGCAKMKDCFDLYRNRDCGQMFRSVRTSQNNYLALQGLCFHSLFHRRRRSKRYTQGRLFLHEYWALQGLCFHSFFHWRRMSKIYSQGRLILHDYWVLQWHCFLSVFHKRRQSERYSKSCLSLDNYWVLQRHGFHSVTRRGIICKKCSQSCHTPS